MEIEIENLRKARFLCEKMLEVKDINFAELQIERYVSDLREHWCNNISVLKSDSVPFLYSWGSLVTWNIISALCLIIGVFSYSELPSEIPVQWSNGVAISLVDKNFIFAYPFTCIVIRILLRPFICAKLPIQNPYRELITEYLTNFLCFVTLSIELFTLLFLNDIVKNIAVILFADAAVFIGILIVGLMKTEFKVNVHHAT